MEPPASEPCLLGRLDPGLWSRKGRTLRIVHYEDDELCVWRLNDKQLCAVADHGVLVTYIDL